MIYGILGTSMQSLSPTRGSPQYLQGMKMSSCFLAFLSIPISIVSMQSLISSKIGVISAVPNWNTICWLSHYPVRTSTTSGQLFMLINSVNAPTYLLRVILWSSSRFLYHIVSWGGASITMSNFGKRSISTKQKLVRSTPPPRQSSISSTQGLLGMKMSSFFLVFLSIQYLLCLWNLWSPPKSG